jgi:hypothetical protein
MGVAVGTVGSDGTTCTPLPGASTATGAGVGAQLTGIISPGTLCVRIYDIGNETNPITYTVTVTHH